MKGRSIFVTIMFCLALEASASRVEVVCEGGILRVTTPKNLADQVKAQLLVFFKGQSCEVSEADAAPDNRVVFEVLDVLDSVEDEQALAVRLKTHLENNVEDCCCGVCQYSSPCCVCEGIDFILSCEACTRKAQEPEQLAEPAEALNIDLMLPPAPAIVPRDVVLMPRLSLTRLHRRSSPSPRSPINRSPKAGSPKSAKSSPKSPHTPRRFMFLFSSDAEDESN